MASNCRLSSCKLVADISPLVLSLRPVRPFLMFVQYLVTIEVLMEHRFQVLAAQCVEVRKGARSVLRYLPLQSIQLNMANINIQIPNMAG